MTRRQYWLAFLDQTHIVVTALTAVFNLYTRSAAVAYFTLGAVVCSQSAKLLKKIIRQPRPVSQYSHKKTYGMPSTHSASITYYAIYIGCACAYLPIHSTLLRIPFIRLVPLITTPWAASILASRVWLGHHTWEQVTAGAACGLVSALVWFDLWHRQGLSDIGNLVEREMAPYIRWG